MRKIPKKNIENSINTLIISICTYLSPIYKKMCFTPNILTTISLLFCILSMYLIYIENYKLAGILFYIAYYFDCNDGFFARKYKMETDFGDKYDHFSDIFKFIGILYIIYIKKKTYYNKENILTLCVLILLCLINIGCQEKYYSWENSKFLKFLTPLCKTKNTIKYSRFFGDGTLMLYLAIVIFYLDKF